MFMLYVSVLLNALNWAPIHLNEKHNFYHLSDPNPINTIWIDSISVLNGDTIFHLNRVAKFENCENWNTCTVNLQAQHFLTKNNKQK